MSHTNDNVLKDVIDMHVHPLVDGKFSASLAMETVEEMADKGMAAVLLKPHFASTTMAANLIDSLISEMQVFGGLIMERSAGGIDPHVVKDEISRGAKKIWMPLMTQNFWDQQMTHPQGYLSREMMENSREHYGPFWSYLNDNGDIRDELKHPLEKVLELIAEADIIFDTGHASAEESLALVEEAANAGVERIVVDHPLAITKQATIDQQQEMANMGAYMEQSWAKLQPQGGNVSAEKYAEAIKAVGPEKTVLVTDYGAGNHPPATKAMQDYIATMKAHGISESDIDLMIKDNPRDLLAD